MTVGILMQFPLQRSFPQSYLTALLSNSFPCVYLLCGVLSLFISILSYFLKLKVKDTYVLSPYSQECIKFRHLSS